jgi:hypothetical protein
MKKALILVIPLLGAGVLVAVLLLLIGNREPPAWQPVLQEYIAYQKSQSRLPLNYTLEASYHATRPWDYQPDLPEIVFGSHYYYRTDEPMPAQDSGNMPLPYPPHDLWCLLVAVHPAASASVQYQVLFAAEHHDLYNATWVIHAPLSPATDPGLRQKLERIGCDRFDVSPASLAYLSR